ncbi:MAG: hypothetical protein ACRCZJ_09475 [Erysipelotrichaceae bacterium]
MTKVLFLQFDSFESFQLQKFNPQMLIVFLLFFYVAYHQQLSIINENSSFLSMELHKKQKKTIIFDIVKESIQDNLWIYFTGSLTILMLSLLFDAFFLSINFTFSEQHIIVVLYFLKFIMFITSSIILIRLLTLVRPSNYYAILTYAVFMILILLDFVFSTNFITISNRMVDEVRYLLFMTLINLGLGLFISISFMKGKELYHD